MKLFELDLQRFNEDVEDDTAEQSGSENSAEEDGQQEPQSKPDFMLKDGRIVFLNEEDGEASDDEPGDSGEDDEEEPKVKDTPAKEQVPDTYTPQQVKDMDFEDLDPKKLPEEMLPWYRSMQAGFTRKMQQLSEQAKTQPKQEEQPPQQRTPDVKEHIQGIASLAKFQACKLLDIQPEDFDRTDDDHEAAYQVAILKINQMVEQNVSKEQALVNFDADMAETDADYNKVKQWAKESWIDVMPHNARMELEVAVQNGDVKSLQKKFYPMMRDAYNKAHGIADTKAEQKQTITEKVAQKSRPAKEPPSLEESKNGDKASKKQFDYANLKGKTFQEQVNMLVGLGLAKP